jgi:cytochrome c
MSITIPINTTKRARLNKVFAKTVDGQPVPTTSAQVDANLLAWIKRQIDKEIERRELNSLADTAEASRLDQTSSLFIDLQGEGWA